MRRKNYLLSSDELAQFTTTLTLGPKGTKWQYNLTLPPSHPASTSRLKFNFLSRLRTEGGKDKGGKTESRKERKERKGKGKQEENREGNK